MERPGELYERQGDAARAAEYYARFAGLWKDADAELLFELDDAGVT